MISKVLIQRLNGEIASDVCYAAWRGFCIKGYRIEFFDWLDMKAGRVPHDRATLVVGGMVEVNYALQSIGVAPPLPLNLPDELAAYRGRKIWTSTWDQIHRQLKAGPLDPMDPVFVKPLKAAKAFTGYVVATLADLEPTMHLSARMELLVSELMDFVSEWRYFVHRQEIVGVAHYQGDCLLWPDSRLVRQAVKDYERAAPIAYSIDFGLTRQGQVLLIEVNDAIALGCYGLGAVRYASMLEDRWLELTATLDGK